MNKAIAAALTKAQRDVQALPRTGYNKHLDAHYTKAEDFIQAGRELLATHGLSAIPQEATIRAEGTVNVLRIKFTVSNEAGDTEEFARELPFTHGPKMSPTDGAAACDTRLMGYFYRGLLQIPQSDETVDEEGEVHAPEQRQAPPSTNGTPPQKIDPAAFIAQSLTTLDAKLSGLPNDALGATPDKLHAQEELAWKPYPEGIRKSLTRAFLYCWIKAKSKYVTDDVTFEALRKETVGAFQGTQDPQPRRDELMRLIEAQQAQARKQRELTATEDDGWR
jgi:hypothetical protein